MSRVAPHDSSGLRTNPVKAACGKLASALGQLKDRGDVAFTNQRYRERGPAKAENRYGGVTEAYMRQFMKRDDMEDDFRKRGDVGELFVTMASFEDQAMNSRTLVSQKIDSAIKYQINEAKLRFDRKTTTFISGLQQQIDANLTHLQDSIRALIEAEKASIARKRGNENAHMDRAASTYETLEGQAIVVSKVGTVMEDHTERIGRATRRGLARSSDVLEKTRVHAPVMQCHVPPLVDARRVNMGQLSMITEPEKDMGRHVYEADLDDRMIEELRESQTHKVPGWEDKNGGGAGAMVGGGGGVEGGNEMFLGRSFYRPKES